MQNAGINALGLDWRYLAYEVRAENLKKAIAGAQTMHFIGLNLTVPHKLLAMNMMDVLDESASEWGAVNTIRVEGRNEEDNWQPIHTFGATPAKLRSHGFNTDADAITQSLREDFGMEARGKTIFLLGAGGAGRVPRTCGLGAGQSRRRGGCGPRRGGGCSTAFFTGAPTTSIRASMYWAREDPCCGD